MDGITPVCAAAWNGRTEAVSRLSEAKCAVNTAHDVRESGEGSRREEREGAAGMLGGIDSEREREEERSRQTGTVGDRERQLDRKRQRDRQTQQHCCLYLRVLGARALARSLFLLDTCAWRFVFVHLFVCVYVLSVRVSCVCVCH